MPDPVRDLYQNLPYPSVSHPSTDPAATAVAARVAGLDVVPPSRARILEIGCATGHNLMPLAVRWPASRLTGIDFCDLAIAQARETANHAGLQNVEFLAADLKEFDPGDGVEYDCIIAHGFYSWVPPEVRQALLEFCRRRLSPSGFALISYNVLPGWSLRKSIVELVRMTGGEPEEMLGRLATAAGNRSPYARHLTGVLHDMFGKCENTLLFDDFGPINEPCTFSAFIKHAGESDLRYLAESQLSEDFPPALQADAAGVLDSLRQAPLVFQQTTDVLTNRTFRRSLLCREDAPTKPVATADILGFAVRCPHVIARVGDSIRLLNRAGEEIARLAHPQAGAFFAVLEDTAPGSLPVQEVVARMTDAPDLPAFADWVLDLARKGLVLLRTEPLRYNSAPPDFPDLGPLGLHAARNGHPLVDIHHHTYVPDEARRRIATHMDGTRSVHELAALAKTLHPQLDFHAWLASLAARGLFG